MIHVLALLSDKESYIRYNRFIKEHTLSEEAVIIIKSMKTWYDRHEDIDWFDYEEWFKVTIAGAMKPDKLSNICNVFTKLQEFDEEIDKDIVNHYVNMDYCTKLAEIGLRGAEGDKVDVRDAESVVSDWHKQLDTASALESYVIEAGLDELLETITTGGYQWRSSFLNRATGDLRQGKLVCFAARPNVGKTTFLATEATHIATQIPKDKYILWINNEEDGIDVKFRVFQAALQATKSEIEADKIEANRKYNMLYGGRDPVKLINKGDVSVTDVEEFIRMYPPALIIFDQLWKVHGYEGSSSNETTRLQRIFSWAREMAKKHAPVITVHQLKTEADGQQWITPAQLYLSGTAIQGEVDTLILMGKIYDPSVTDERYLSIGKNKGAYGATVEEDLKEGRSTWTIDAPRARFIEPAHVAKTSTGGIKW